MLGLCITAQLYGQHEKYVLVEDSNSLHEEHFHEVAISGKSGHSQPKSTRAVNQSTEEHLEQIQGLSLVRRGNYAAEPSFRGLNANQTSVTIDGMKIFGACTDRMDPVSSYVAPENLEKACMDQTGDCNASCNMASLDLRTKKLSLIQRKTNGFINAGYNSNGNGITGSGELNFQKGKQALRVQAYYSEFGNYTAGGGNEIPFTQFTKWNASLQYKLRLSDKAIFNVKYIIDRATNIGYPALPMDVAKANGDILSLEYKKVFQHSILKSAKVKLYGNSIYHEMDDSKRPNVIIHMDMPGWSQTAGAYTIISTQFGRHKLETKPEYYWNKAYAEMTMYPNGEGAMFMLTWPDVRRNSGLISVHHSYNTSKKFRLKNSLQIEHQSSEVKDEFGLKQLEAIGNSSAQFSRRTGHLLKTEVQKQISRLGMFTLKLASIQRIPNVSEQYGYYLFNSLDLYDYIGNPDLRNEHSTQFELGYSTQKKKLRIQAQAYSYFIKNYIIGITSDLDAMTLGAKGVREYQNIAQATIMGFEAVFNYELSEALSLESQNNFTRGRMHDGAPLPLIPTLKTLNSIAYSGPKFSCKLLYTYSGEQNDFADTYGERFTEAYHLFDFNGSVPFQLWNYKSEFGMSIRNIFDAHYVDHMDWNKVPRIGRSANFNLKVLF